MSDSSFMKSLFFGEIEEDLLFPYPKVASETRETVRMILDTLHRFSKEQVKSSEWDEKGEMPEQIVKDLAEMGMMGLAVPEANGGLGLPQSGYVRVMQEWAKIDAALAVTLGAHQSIGYKALLLFGNEEQKKKYLPRLASGELIASYCLTEPSSGSDAASIKTKAVPDGEGYRLTGNKLWITNGGIASFLTVFAKVPVDGQEKVTCFMVDVPSEGIQVGPSEHKMGIRSSWTNAIHFDNVFVPKENVIGGLGKGFKVAMGVLNHGRLGLAGGCVGIGKECLAASATHANERVQFKKKLREFGMIQEKIARMATNLYAAESMVFMTTSLIDRGSVDYSLESAISKVFATEMLWALVDENVQIWGGGGYMKEYPYERWLRDARIFRIFEGTNEILRAFIALSGMQGPGQELAGLADAIKYPLKGLGQVTDFAMKRIKRNLVGESITKAHPSLKKMSSMIEDYAVEFSGQVETLLRRHGKQVFLAQMAQKRVADVAIDIYALSCVLSRLSSRLAEEPADKCELEISLARNFFRKTRRRIRGNFSSLHKNEDDMLKQISNEIFDRGGYPFEVV